MRQLGLTSWRKLLSGSAAVAMLGLSACATHKPVASEDPIQDPFDKAQGDESAGSSADSKAEAALPSEGPAVKGSVKHHHKHGSSRTPKVAAKPIQKDGFWLNAYYFVRRDGASWEDISNILYGRPDRADLLKSWNRKAAPAAGTLIYYNSPARPEDSETMKDFAQDFGYSLERVEVKQGDWLSKIAASHYGAAAMWKEIAVLNPELANPDSIEVGQVLNVAPSDVDTRKVLEQIIASVSQEQEAAAPIKEEIPPAAEVAAQADAPVAAAIPPPASVAAPKAQARPIVSSTRPPLSANKGFGNTQLLALGGVVVAAAAAAWLRMRRKKQQAKNSSVASEFRPPIINP